MGSGLGLGLYGAGRPTRNHKALATGYMGIELNAFFLVSSILLGLLIWAFFRGPVKRSKKVLIVDETPSLYALLRFVRQLVVRA